MTSERWPARQRELPRLHLDRALAELDQRRTRGVQRRAGHVQRQRDGVGECLVGHGDVGVGQEMLDLCAEKLEDNDRILQRLDDRWRERMQQWVETS